MSDAAPPLVALGLTRYWRAEDGLRLDAGPFVRALEYAAGRTAVVLGKPDPAFYHSAVEDLDLEPDQVVMVGDDVRSDVEGAQRAGLTGVLVRTGKFSPSDLDGGVSPDAVLDSIADLPRWWARALNAADGHGWRGSGRRRVQRGVAEEVDPHRDATDRGRLPADEDAGRAGLPGDHEEVAGVLEPPAETLDLAEDDGGA